MTGAPGTAGSRLGIAAAAVAVFGVAGFVPVIAGAAGGDQGAATGVTLTAMMSRASQACVVDGPVAGLDSQQAAFADQIVSAAFAASGEDQQVARMSLMVAWTESRLRDLGPMAGNDGSLGLFQQRGWGTPTQEMDPAVSTALFVARLEALTGWRHLPPWTAAKPSGAWSRICQGSSSSIS